MTKKTHYHTGQNSEPSNRLYVTRLITKVKGMVDWSLSCQTQQNPTAPTAFVQHLYYIYVIQQQAHKILQPGIT